MAQNLYSSKNGMKRIKFLYSYGGVIVPRLIDGELRYVGGQTRILSVHHSITYSELMMRFGDFCGSSIDLKCKLPNEDLNFLVTIRSDEDLRYVIDDYDRVSPAAKIRAVLFPIDSTKEDSVPSSPMSCFDLPSSTKSRVIPSAPPAPSPPALQRCSYNTAKKPSPPSSPMSCFDFPSSTKPRAIPPTPTEASRPAVQPCTYAAKKASPPPSPSPISSLDLPSTSQPCVLVPPPAAVYYVPPPCAVVPMFLYPTIGYPVVAGKSHCCQGTSLMQFYHVPHRNNSGY